MQFPDTCEVAKESGTNNVRIRFGYDDHPTQEVHLDQHRLLGLIAQLQQKIEMSPLTPISLERLRPGKTISVKGTSFQMQMDGSLRIHLLAEFEDRMVSLPFTLAPEGVDELKKTIIGQV